MHLYRINYARKYGRIYIANKYKYRFVYGSGLRERDRERAVRIY